jgi:hypothetical protein
VETDCLSVLTDKKEHHMTEANGPAAAEAAADNRTSDDPNAGNGSSASGDWLAGLEGDNRSLVEAKGWRSVNDAIKSYREAETRLGQTLSVPGKDATAEDWNKLYDKLGRPGKPTDYALKVDRTNLPADLPYDETFSIEFRNWAHEQGLNNRQAQALHDKYVAKFADGFRHNARQLAAEQQTAHRDLTAKWGDPQSEGYKREVELMSRAARHLGLTEALAKGGLITADGGIRNSQLALALARVGSELFAEDSFAAGGGGVVSNPFADGNAFNVTEQGKLVRSDPNKARALIRAAGKDPVRYGL